MSSSELYYPIAEDSRTKGSIVSGLLNVSNSIVVSHDVRMLAFIQAGCLTMTQPESGWLASLCLEAIPQLRESLATAFTKL